MHIRFLRRSIETDTPQRPIETDTLLEDGRTTVTDCRAPV